MNPNPSPPPRFRVEHHEGGTVRFLGSVVDVPRHHASLAPFASDLLRRGADGELRLIDEVTGKVVARRRVRPVGAKPRDRVRAP